ALGEVGGAILAGSVNLPFSLGTRICLSQLSAGLALGPLFVGQFLGGAHGGTLWWALLRLGLSGLVSAPLTIWAHTLRMQIIPERLRGRTFALLRTLMQGSGPLASAMAGVLLPVLGLIPMIAFSAGAIGIPGLAGYQVHDLRQDVATVA